MMGSFAFSLFVFMGLLFSFTTCFDHLPLTVAADHSSSNFKQQQPLLIQCHDDERSALLQFNQSFLIHVNASLDPSAYPKTASWKLNESSRSSSDCCLWDGVECDAKTGHVISLDLSSSFLYGSLNSSSTLFRLIHLQKLNLADNNFNYSQIPSTIGLLSRLTHLNLSFSNFSGQIPSKISELSKLASLDLCCNVDSSFQSLLKLEKPNYFLQNLTDLKVLSLIFVNISSVVPDILANFSSLTTLFLTDCGLHGEFPTRIFQLPNLQSLSLMCNPYLTGYLPEFNKSNPLKYLKVAGTSFSGKLPDSIGDLNSLKEFDISDCNFSRSVPSSVGNLTQLTTLDLSVNDFDRSSLAWLGKQAKLTSLALEDINLIGDIPSSLRNLTQLAQLDLYSNQLTGQIPSWLANLTQLTSIGLSENKFHGLIPQSFHGLMNLEYLSLGFNNLNGRVELDMFINLKNLFSLQLSGNNLSLLTNTNMNTTLPKFKFLALDDCNLSEFPDLLRHQNELGYLGLKNNRIHGQIPKWIWNVGKETLWGLSVYGNFLTGFDQPPIVFPWTNIRILGLGSNMLQGSLPIPPLSISYYSVSNNSLTGEISPLICNLTSLHILNLSYNNFSGILPLCLENIMDSLSVLNLENNNFHGTIPQICTSGSKLKMLDLSQNQLQGSAPRSLANCKKLEILDFGNNRINGVFPPWLGTFSELRVLNLRSNEFHGAIGSSETKFEFFKLRIIDLSNNSFTGKFPFEHINNWNAMKIVGEKHLTYIRENTSIVVSNNKSQAYYYNFSMEITNKGMKTYYSRVPDNLVVIDFSSNKFEGDIPESIGNLRGIQLLNLSNNILTGPVPSWLANLTELESLDLSQNKLSGEIPQKLTALTFLAFFNISHNNLMGPIPQGKQFDTFENNSFEGNLGLCGKPLSKKCGKSKEVSPLPPLTSEHSKDSKFPSGYDWIFLVAGYGSGLAVGLVIGHTFTIRKHEWFVENFGRRPQKSKGRRKGARKQKLTS